eukprot:2942350-Rhodomonas_salina.1
MLECVCARHPEARGLRAACPVFDALAFRSYAAHPALVFARGGTAQGFGRCNAQGCRSTQPPPLPAWCSAAACGLPADMAE